MARDFSKNTSNYMRLGANAIGALINGASAISVHLWANLDTISTTSGDNDLFVVWGSNAGITVRLAVHDGTNAVLRVSSRPVATETQRNVVATTTVTTGTWHSFGAAIDYAGDLITPYFKGIAEGATSVPFTAVAYSTSTPTTSFDSIGSNGTPAATGVQVDGRIAEVAVWDADIGAAGFAALAAGISALFVRPDRLVFYMPLIGNDSPERDVVSGLSGTITGTVAKAEHCRVYRPLGRSIFKMKAASGTTYNDTLNESITGADSYTGLLTMAATYSESVTAGESLSAGMIFGPTLSESVSAGESLTTTLSTSGSVSESWTCGDVYVTDDEPEEEYDGTIAWIDVDASDLSTLSSGSCYPVIYRVMCDPPPPPLDPLLPPEDFWPEIDDSLFADDFVARARNHEDPGPSGPPIGVDIDIEGGDIGNPPHRGPVEVDTPGDDIGNPPDSPSDPPTGDPETPGGGDVPGGDTPGGGTASPIHIGID